MGKYKKEHTLIAGQFPQQFPIIHFKATRALSLAFPDFISSSAPVQRLSDWELPWPYNPNVAILTFIPLLFIFLCNSTIATTIHTVGVYRIEIIVAFHAFSSDFHKSPRFVTTTRGHGLPQMVNTSHTICWSCLNGTQHNTTQHRWKTHHKPFVKATFLTRAATDGKHILTIC